MEKKVKDLFESYEPIPKKVRAVKYKRGLGLETGFISKAPTTKIGNEWVTSDDFPGYNTMGGIDVPVIIERPIEANSMILLGDNDELIPVLITEFNERYKKVEAEAVICKGETQAGKPCKRPAVKGSEYCASHMPDAK